MKKYLVVLMLVFSQQVFAQKIKIVSGDLSPLKDQTSVNTIFTYDKMIVGKDLTEEEYIKQKKGDYNGKEKGRGEKWEAAWKEDRKNRFEPQFRELFSKHSGLNCVDQNAKYTMKFNTTRTEPGWNVGVAKMPAFIDGEITIFETANPENIIAIISLLKSPGRDAMGFDYETGMRLQEAYAKAGKGLGKFIKSNKTK